MLEQADITDRRAAAVFKAPLQREILLTLIEREQSLSDLSGLTGASLNLLHHHIAKFLRLRLVEVAREAPRAGAPIKFYRATARAFFVPAELMDADPGAGSSGQLRELLERSLAGSLKGALYAHDGAGPRMRLIRDAGRSKVTAELWLDLRLNEADAASLADELKAILGRFRSASNDRGRRYLVHAAIAPA